MARFNRFGATYAQAIALYPGTVIADYDAGGGSGQTKVEAVMDRITREVASALTPDVYRQMTEVDAQEVVRYATDGQSTATLGLVPALTGTYHLWAYPNINLADSRLADLGEYGEWVYRKPGKGVNELTGYSVTASTGAITGLSLSTGDRLYATYDVDVDSASYSLASVADIMLLGVAAELGSNLYTEGTQEWKAVTEYRDRYNKWLEALREGAWVPDELRKLTYWTEIERTSSEVKSVPWSRG